MGKRFRPSLVTCFNPRKPAKVTLFQSHNGAIAAVRAGVTTVGICNWFQSHNGAIAAKGNGSVWWAKFSVSIPQWCDCCHVLPQETECFLHCFNPTMVRLLRANPPKSQLNGLEFQSHNGAIAAIRQGVSPSVSTTSFNPTMVRLLLDAERDEVLQFDSFNPTMVRLLRCVSCGHGKTVVCVSIPQWCDCCTFRSRSCRWMMIVSIPQWCDCCHVAIPVVRPVVPSFNPTMVRLLLGNQLPQ